jgi:hypothetical protein
MLFRLLLSIACVLLMLSLHNSACAAEAPQSVEVPDNGVTAQLPDEDDEEEQLPPMTVLNQGEASIGYRFVAVDGSAARTTEYESLHPSTTGRILFSSLGKEFKLNVDGSFLGRDDFSGDIYLDSQGKYKIHLRTDSFFHNLENERLFPLQFTLAGVNIPDQQDAAVNYGMRVEQNLAEFRYKPFLYPLHLNFGYWRLLREGVTQNRFADFGFISTDPAISPANRIIARQRAIDRQIHEGTFGIDSHLGPIDLIYQFQIRQLQVKDATQTFQYVDRDTRAGGLFPHNVDPESRYISNSLKIHTSLTGGLVGAASVSYGKRDVPAADVSGGGASRATLLNAAGEMTYTPLPEFTAALRYRHQQIEVENPASLIIDSFVTVKNPTGELAPRPSIDTEHDIITLSTAFRPLTQITLNTEYKADITRRSHTEPTVWNLPDETVTHRGTISFLARLVKGLRFRAQYGYTAVDNPAYGSSFEKRHSGETQLTYNSTNRWGFIAGYRITRESNDQFFISSRSTPPISFQLPRERSNQTATASFWLSPFSNFSLSAGYQRLKTAVDQTLLLDSFNNIAAGSSYSTGAHLYSISGTYNASESLELALALQHMRSRSIFAPGAAVVGSLDTSGIEEISRRRTFENSLSFRSEYYFTKNVSCGLNYRLQAYRDQDQPDFDGTVHMIGASVTARW